MLRLLSASGLLTLNPTKQDGEAQGIEKYGIGGWNDISAELLPKWDDQAIRVKASRLMGSQSLARYVGWKGSKCAPTGWHTGYGAVRLPALPARVYSCAASYACVPTPEPAAA